MVTNVTSLLKTVKTVEDEAARGTRALESSIEAITQEIKVSHPAQGHFGLCELYIVKLIKMTSMYQNIKFR